MKTPKQIVGWFWTGFAERRFDSLMHELIAESCEIVMPGMPPLCGHAPIRQMFEAYARAFPDFAWSPLCELESGDLYAGEARYRGTHRAPLAIPQGELPATGRTVTWESADIVRIADGKIISWHIYHDPIKLFAQLGVAMG